MTATKRIALASLAITMAFAQGTPKKAPKPFVEPPVRMAWLVKDARVFKNEGYARDFVRAQGMEGVEKSKLIADIVKFGGVEIGGGYAVRLLGQVEIQAGERKIMFRKIALPGSILPFGLVPESELTDHEEQRNCSPDVAKNINCQVTRDGEPAKSAK